MIDLAHIDDVALLALILIWRDGVREHAGKILCAVVIETPIVDRSEKGEDGIDG